MRRRFLALLIFAALAGCAATPAEHDDATSIAALIQASADAWNRGDLAGHLSLYDPAVTAMTKNGPRPGVAAIEAAFRSAYFNADGQPKQTLRMENVAVRRIGADAALSTGRFVLEGGALAPQSGWFTLVWQRTPSGWKAVHDHSS